MDEQVGFPETRWERLVDRIRHWWHVRRLPPVPPPEPDNWDPPLCEIVVTLLDDD